MKTRKRKRAGGQSRRWMVLTVTMPTPEELSRGMEIATTFEDRHGGKPPMYFARYTGNNVIAITVLTTRDNRALKNMFKKLGVHSVKVEERGAGSWEHCHMYQVAKHIHPKTPQSTQDVVHWLHNMLGYSYLQEVRNYIDTSNAFITHLIPRPNEPIPKPA